MDTAVSAALISGIIAVLGVIASIVTARWEISLRSKELDIKTKELESAAKAIESEIESLRQTQFTEILRKRIETYPKLWALLLKYNRHWKMSKRPRDANWAKEQLSALNDINGEIGIFFSQDVYEKFAAYRNALVKIESSLSAGDRVPPEELDALEAMIVGKTGSPGLATSLKNDLGSYREIAIAIPKSTAKSQP
jgi:hypothetical protein